MSALAPFIVVGENIHCTLVYKTAGAFVKEDPAGRSCIRYTWSGTERLLPIPEQFRAGEEWARGNVKHVAVAMWLGVHGDEVERAAAADYVRHLALRQEEAGAAYLDLNVDELSTDIPERERAMEWAAGVVQESTRLPLSIDTSNLSILRAGLAACDGSRGAPLVNSVSLERLPAVEVAREHSAMVLAAATGPSRVPTDVEERLANLAALIEHLRTAGFRMSQVYLDPLVFPVSVDTAHGLHMLACIRELRSRHGPEAHFAPGLSNVSYGMPNRKLLNQVFARLCRDAGLDGAIANPLHVNAAILEKLDTVSEAYRKARAFLMGEDPYGMEFIAASREGRI